MNTEIYEQITDVLKHQALPLARIHAIALDAGSNWTESQIHLFLICMGGVEIDTSSEGLMVRSGQRTEQEELVDTIRQVVRSRGGRPVPAGEIRRLLPSRFTTTEDQIKALAKKTPGLEVFGPGLIRITD